MLWQLYQHKGGGYWKGLNVVSCWIGAIIIVLLAVKIEKSKDNILKRIVHISGIESFGIYIWHMPIAGIVARIMCIGLLNWAVLIRPIIVLIVVIIILWIAKKIINRTKFHKYLRYLGLRL